MKPIFEELSKVLNDSPFKYRISGDNQYTIYRESHSIIIQMDIPYIRLINDYENDIKYMMDESDASFKEFMILLKPYLDKIFNRNYKLNNFLSDL